jgi:hypothetical protein
LNVKIGQMSSPAKPPRTPWGNFPDVLIHASESAVKQHPAYGAAKSGSGAAATALVNATMSDTVNLALLRLLPGRTPILVSAHAYEREGINAIPESFAVEISKALGWPHDMGVAQMNVAAHTGADGFSRMARQAEFTGGIQPGVEYVLVDDFVGIEPAGLHRIQRRTGAGCGVPDGQTPLFQTGTFAHAA